MTDVENDFKILAIRPTAGCNKNMLKVLTVDKMYWLYNNYLLEGNRIVKDNAIADGLFDTGDLKVNISAIVGVNGSGKSSLVELLYVSTYNIAVHLKVLPEKNDDGETLQIEKKVNVEIFYQDGDSYYLLKLHEGSISLFSHGSDPEQNFDTDPVDFSDKKHLADLFYSIGINYSHFSLSSLHLGKWIKNVFHKNDGYQTPIVLNPYREEGNIDIKTEEYLTRSRLITNLLISDEEFRSLLPRKQAERIKFTLDAKKPYFDKKEAVVASFLYDNRKAILDNVLEILGDIKVADYESKDKNLKTAYDYIVKKTFRIWQRYAPYTKKKFDFVNEGKTVKFKFNQTNLRNLLQELKTDPSHITLKLLQAINFIKNYEFFKSRIGLYVSIEQLGNDLRQLVGSKDLINYLPPSFFNFEIKFRNRTVFSSLSSGEKQKIFALSTIWYHILNLDSVKEGESYIKYGKVNIVFDEIELYFHPEMQRTFINDFLTHLAKLQLSTITSVNCIFVTHSPFILSDIPKQNILFLKADGTPHIGNEKTFGANIHEILGYSFFLENGFIGEFAKDKIERLIDFYNRENDDFDMTSSLKLISLIDDELISERLREMHDDRFTVPDENTETYVYWLEQELIRIRQRNE